MIHCVSDLSASRRGKNITSVTGISRLLACEDYSLFCIKTDDVINIIKSLGPGAFFYKAAITNGFQFLSIFEVSICSKN